MCIVYLCYIKTLFSWISFQSVFLEIKQKYVEDILDDEDE